MNSQIMTPNIKTKIGNLKKRLLLLTDPNNDDMLRQDGLEFISNFYLKYSKNISASEDQSQTTDITINELKNTLEVNTHTRMLVADMRKIVPDIEQFTTTFFIHGSLATSDYTGFSDVDACIIIKDTVMNNDSVLRQLKNHIKNMLRIVLRTDNLQHHGFFFIPESFLKNLPQSYLPIDVLKHARVIVGESRLNIRANANKRIAIDNFSQLSDNFTERKLHSPSNLYDAKRLLSQFMLLPTLFLQTQGVYVYKKYSFEMIKSTFHENWWAMDRVSKIRREWVRPKSNLFNILVDISPNPWLISTLFRKVNWQIPGWLSNQFNQELYSGMIKLAQRMREHINQWQLQEMQS